MPSEESTEMTAKPNGSCASLHPEPEEEETRLLLDMAFHAFVEVNPCGLITDWNSQAENTFGWPRAKALGQSFGSLIVSSNDRDSYQTSVEESFASGAGSSLNKRMEITALHQDGREFPIELAFFFSACGEIPRLGAFVRDLSPPKPPEKEIEERRRRLADQLAEAYHEVDLRGNFTFINKHCRAGNFWNNSHIGTSYKQVFISEEAVGLRERYHEVYQTGKPIRIEYPRTHNGQTVFHEQSVSLLRNADGNPVGFAVLSRDCTQRKRNEIEVVKAKEAAVAASKAKSEFLANMSHELRTPLNGVMGMLELARQTELTAEQGELLKMAKDSANSLLVVINDILDFSKIEAGRLELDCAEFDLVGAVAEAMDAKSLDAHQKGLELAYDIAPDVPDSVVGDSLRLKQVLMNLLGNAIKFTQRGEVVLRVERAETQILDSPQLQLKFSISDTGIGIPEHQQRLIFEAFAQADGSSTRKYGGTGLGLAICSRIVKLMGGDLSVESKVGEGSTFYFIANFAPAEKTAVLQAAQPKVELQGVRVLIVDDNLTNRRILQGMLVLAGMLPVKAESGKQALQLMRKAAAEGNPFPLVLVDYQMPEMDGFQLVEQIQDNPALSAPAVLMLTSDDYQSSARRAREAGIGGYLPKPVRQSDLFSQICALLQPAPESNDGAARVSRQQQEETTRPLNVLLAEDNLINQKLAVRLLQRSGHRVTVAVSGKQALAKLEEGSFDLVLMDVEMPELDGWETTAAIRAYEEKTQLHVPIIAMTAHATGGDRERCLAAGMDDYVSKPINAKELEETIRRVTETHSDASLRPVSETGTFSVPGTGA